MVNAEVNAVANSYQTRFWGHAEILFKDETISFTMSKEAADLTVNEFIHSNCIWLTLYYIS